MPCGTNSVDPTSVPTLDAMRGAPRSKDRGRARTFWVAAIVASCLAACPVAAQTPYVPDDWKFGKRQDSNTLHYCLDARDPDFPVARKIGALIASALLLQPKEHVIGDNLVGEDLDNLYRVFLETCDLYLGFKLIPDAYPEWLTVTRPYYRAGYVVAVTDAAWKSLADMPRSLAIGATIGTAADIRLIQYLLALPAKDRWSRFPHVVRRGRAPIGHARHDGRGAGLGAVAVGAAGGRSGLRQAARDRVRSAAGIDRRHRRGPAGERDVPAQQRRPGDRLADR